MNFEASGDQGGNGNALAYNFSPLVRSRRRDEWNLHEGALDGARLWPPFIDDNQAGDN
jgi:hypothetical protein